MTEVGARRPATSRDVAEHAGLSRSTVSQVLNGYGDRFSAETRARVLAAASNLDYRPSQAARALVTGVSDVIVVVLPPLALGARIEEAVHLVTEQAAQLGKNVLVRIAGPDPSATIQTLIDVRPAMVVDFGGIEPTLRHRLVGAGIVLIPRSEDPSPDFDLNQLIGRVQAGELLRDRSRTLVFVKPDDGHTNLDVRGRADAFARAARDLGAAEPVHINAPLDTDGLRALLEPHVAAARLGVACYNDDVAIAVLAAARDGGWSIPDQIAVIGVDGTRVGQLVSPRVTSVSIDLPLVMQEVLRGLRQSIRGGTDAEPRAALNHSVELLPGETT